MKYTSGQREAIAREMAGKTVASLQWSADEDGSDGYWVMVFTDGSEMCFRLMAELAGW